MPWGGMLREAGCSKIRCVSVGKSSSIMPCFMMAYTIIFYWSEGENSNVILLLCSMMRPCSTSQHGVLAIDSTLFIEKSMPHARQHVARDTLYTGIQWPEITSCRPLFMLIDLRAFLSADYCQFEVNLDTYFWLAWWNIYLMYFSARTGRMSITTGFRFCSWNNDMIFIDEIFQGGCYYRALVVSERLMPFSLSVDHLP